MIGTPDVWVYGVCIACGLGAAHLAGRWFGLPGALLGLPVGAAGTFGLMWGLAAVWYYCAGHILPPCHEGTCGGNMGKVDGDYKMVPSLGEGYWRCACGHVYRRARWRIHRRSEDGSLEPYMQFHPLRGWRRVAAADDPPDTGPRATSDDTGEQTGEGRDDS